MRVHAHGTWGGTTLKELNPIERKGSSREADGWYDDDCVYILATRIVGAAGIGLKRAQIGRILDEQRLLLIKDADRKRIGSASP